MAGQAIALLVFYFLPTFIAMYRGKKNIGIVVVVNFFTGITVVGWVVALAMAFGEKK